MLKMNNEIENNMSLFNVENMPDNNKYNFKYIDLFAGIGGIRTPFQNLGGKCVFSSEIDKYAQETYEANYGEKPSGDITKIPASTIPNFDVLLAGFPCQAFSIAGKREGFNDTRGTMFFEVERILEEKRPKCFLLENVKGLTNHNKGKTFQTMLDILENKLKYKVYHKVLNAKNFGLPQNRERIMIVGFKNHDIDFHFPDELNIPTRLGNILESNPDDKYTISDKIWASHQMRKERNREKGNGFGYCLFNENSEYTSTISARYYKDGSEILIDQSDKGKNPRKLTPREAARLQGYPDSFKIVVSDTQAYKQFGNSVPVNMIDAVAKEMYKALIKGGEI